MVAGWAVARQRPDDRARSATYRALAFGVAGSLVLAVWQRTEGVSGLVQLGLTYGDRVRQAPGGELRAFGVRAGTARLPA